jgi:hypothetical protein
VIDGFGRGGRRIRRCAITAFSISGLSSRHPRRTCHIRDMVFGDFCAGTIQALIISRMKILIVDQARIGQLAFEIGEARGHQRRFHALAR